jgi:WD repeat-containing protein 55
VSSLTPLPPSKASTSGFSKQWVTVGGTTLAVTDLRKGVLSRSSDQDAELLSSAFVDGFSTKGTNVGSKMIVGDGSGVLTLWERGVWDDQDERIVLDRGINEASGESVECLVNIPLEIAGNGKMLAAGMGGGLIAAVQLGDNKVIDTFRHDEIESVVSIGFDSGNRMISGGGQTVKVWEESFNADDNDGSDVDEIEITNGDEKRPLSSESDSSDEDSSNGDESVKKRSRKKKKRRKPNGSQASLGTNMGIFKGLD